MRKCHQLGTPGNFGGYVNRKHTSKSLFKRPSQHATSAFKARVKRSKWRPADTDGLTRAAAKGSECIECIECPQKYATYLVKLSYSARMKGIDLNKQ
ncbi:hypothetical protein BaRGS_00026790, partial [Batillaria attramentaria]